MPKVRVTYKDIDNKVREEITWLLSDNDPLFTADGISLGLFVSDIHSGFVMFEDEYGIFGLNPHAIVKIETVEES